jgi:hypothetical protein
MRLDSEWADNGRLDQIIDDTLEDTDELQTDWKAGGRLDLLINLIKARTDTIPESFKKNTAVPNFTFLMVDALDGYSPKGGLSVTGQVMGDGATSFSSLTNSVTEVSLANALGNYRVNLAAADLNYDFGVFRFTASGGRTLHIYFRTIP